MKDPGWVPSLSQVLLNLQLASNIAGSHYGCTRLFYEFGLSLAQLMAHLWFCEIVAREVLLTASNVPNFLKNEFTSQKQIEDRYIINLDDLAAAQRIVRL